MPDSRRLAQDALLKRVGGKELVGWHRSHCTNIDAEQYLNLYRRQLLRGIQECSRIYLDTNYWVRIRDAEIGKGSDAAGALLARLRELVRSRRGICIAHASVFLELAKQAGDSLRVTARLFDELTEGVVIAPPRELRFFELVQFMAARTGQVAPGETSCWSKIGRVLKTEVPEQMPGPCTEFDRQVILKCALDTAWQTGLEDLFAQFGWQTKQGLNADIEADVIAEVEALKATRLADGWSRKQMRVAEFSALLHGSVSAEFVDDLLGLAKRSGRSLDRMKVEKQTRTLLEKAIQEFESNSLGPLLPNAVLTTELFVLYAIAALDRRLTPNDWADWQHAAAAVPYCDLFLTERHLASQLTQVLHADDRYGCCVVGTLEGALEGLDSDDRAS